MIELIADRCGGSASEAGTVGAMDLLASRLTAPGEPRREHQRAALYRFHPSGRASIAPYNQGPPSTPPNPGARVPPLMSRIEDLTDRVERLLLRHDELQRTNALLQQQLQVVSQERDSLRARLSAARSRIDALIDKLPAPVDAGGDASDPSDEPAAP